MENKKTMGMAEKPKMNKNNKFLLIFVCIFTAVVLVLGIIFGTVAIITDMNAAVRLDAVMIDTDTAKVFAAYHKSFYLASLRNSGYENVYDTESFWNSAAEDGKTQRDLYELSLKNYISGIMAGASLVNEKRALTAEEKAKIKEKNESFISYYGSVEAFNQAVEHLGFDYDDFCRAMELSFASNLALGMMYGYQGEVLKSGGAGAAVDCENYLSTYSRVKLIFLCDEKIMIKDSDGEYVEYYLTEGDKEERKKIADELRDAIRCENEGLDGAITETMFDLYIEKGDTVLVPDLEKGTEGSYLHPSAAATQLIAREYPEITERAFEMEIGDYAEVETEVGVCFIYKCTPESGAYKDDENLYFSDFYSDAASYLYTEVIKILASEADFREIFYEADLIKIPESNKFFITDWN